MTKYNAVISTDAQGKIEIVVNEDDESFDFETESTIYLGECFSDDELNELLEKKIFDRYVILKKDDRAGQIQAVYDRDWSQSL